MRLHLLILRLTCLMLTNSSYHAQAFDHTHGKYAKVLKKYVTDQGVDYAKLKSDPIDLELYLEDLSSVEESEFESWDTDNQLAFLLNLYNASTLELIAKHYPVKSIRKIGGLFRNPWKLKVVRVWGESRSLDWLEHEIIRTRYEDPRIHFALVCAAKGCPPLRQEPFIGHQLQDQLEDQTSIFIGQSEKNRVDLQNQILYLSPIFKWYRDDFVGESSTIVEYVRPYFPEGVASELTVGEFDVKFTDYDWTLNDSGI